MACQAPPGNERCQHREADDAGRQATPTPASAAACLPPPTPQPAPATASLQPQSAAASGSPPGRPPHLPRPNPAASPGPSPGTAGSPARPPVPSPTPAPTGSPASTPHAPAASRRPSPLERGLSPVGLVEDQAEGVQVALHRGRRASEPLRRHVGDRAPRSRPASSPARLHRQPEIRDARLATAIDHYVRGLQVAVAAYPCRAPQRALHRADGPPPALRRGQPSDPPQQRRQILPSMYSNRQEGTGPAPRRHRKTRQTFGCETVRALRTSASSRSRAAGSRSRLAGRNFKPPSWPRRRSSARYTSPIPPRPASATIR